MKHKFHNQGYKVLYIALAFYLGAGVAAGIAHKYLGSYSSISTVAAASTGETTRTITGYIDTTQELLTNPLLPEAEGGEEAAPLSSAGEDIPPLSPVPTGAAVSDAAVSGEALEAEAEETAPADRRYFRFEVTTRQLRLHLRTEPSLMAPILDRLDKGTQGYIITPGTDWSYLITDDGRLGYCFNGYLALTEINPSDYPTEYLELEPPVPLD